VVSHLERYLQHGPSSGRVFMDFVQDYMKLRWRRLVLWIGVIGRVETLVLRDGAENIIGYMMALGGFPGSRVSMHEQTALCWMSNSDTMSRLLLPVARLNLLTS
jgi:hypothetical protein